jgi:hypothetical protein
MNGPKIRSIWLRSADDASPPIAVLKTAGVHMVRLYAIARCPRPTGT